METIFKYIKVIWNTTTILIQEKLIENIKNILKNIEIIDIIAIIMTIVIIYYIMNIFDIINTPFEIVISPEKKEFEILNNIIKEDKEISCSFAHILVFTFIAFYCLCLHWEKLF